jgi:dTMP kinase
MSGAVVGRGRLIAFEGGEGAGKSTQARLLAESLERHGIACLLTREPGGTAGAEAIRELLLHRELPRWGARAEALLFAAARADHVERVIAPALASGRWVVTDRFVDSSRAYQGEAGELGDQAVLDLHRIGSGGLLPDGTVLLTVAPEAVAARLRRRDGATADRIGGRDQAFHARVAAGFARIARAEPDRFLTIDDDNAGGPEAIHARVHAALARRYPELR